MKVVDRVGDAYKVSFAVGVVLHVVTHYHHPDFVYPQATTAWALVTYHVDDPPGSYPHFLW